MKTLSNFEKIAQKNKRKNLLKIVSLSTILTLAATAAIFYGLQQKVSSNGKKIQDHYLLMSEIAYPNVDYISWGYRTSSYFSGDFYSNRVKDIDGILVPFEKYNASYSIYMTYDLNQDEGLNLLDGGQSYYTYGNHFKVPIFYNTGYSGEYNLKVTQDLDFIPKMTGQAVEVAITFDKPYTLAQIDAMVPDNLKLNWIWIGQAPTEVDFGDRLDQQFGFDNYSNVALSAEDQAALEKEVDAAMEKDKDADLNAIYEKYQGDSTVDPLVSLQNSYSNFQIQLQKYLDIGYGFVTITDADGNEYSAEDYLKDYLEANKDPKTAKFAGIILTGRAENFAQLQNADWIYASNIGQSVQIQPYHKLDK